MRLKILKILCILLVVLSCKNTEMFEDSQKNEMIAAFKRLQDETLVDRDIIYFPQWQNSLEFKGITYIPLTTDKRISSFTPDGLKYSLDGRLWLAVNKYKDNWNFSILKVLPNDPHKAKQLGIFVYEDWKTGGLSYDGYIKTKLFSSANYERRVTSVEDTIRKRAGAGIPVLNCRAVNYEVCAGNGGEERCTIRHDVVCTKEELVTDPDTGGDGGGGGGGSSGGSDNGTDIPPIVKEDEEEKEDPPIKIVFKCGTARELVNLGFVEEVENALVDLKNGVFTDENITKPCFMATFFNALAAIQGTEPLKICLKVSETGASGTYQSGTIGFIAPSVSKEVFFHELIHYYQDISGVYPGFNQMGGNGKGFANIEFETQLMIDIVNGYGDGYLNQLDESLFFGDEYKIVDKEYRDWLGEIFLTDGVKIKDMSILNQPAFKNGYLRFLKLYATKSKYYKSEIFESMEPSVLKSLFSQPTINCN